MYPMHNAPTYRTGFKGGSVLHETEPPFFISRRGKG
jgi:hypothetical protein